MRLFQRLILLSMAVFVASCATPNKRPQLTEVTIPPERIVENGYSLMPLNEAGWMYGPRNSSQFSLVKKGANPDETYAIQGMLHPVPIFSTNEEFLQLVKRDQANDTPPQRFKLLTHDVTSFPMKGAVCARTYLSAEDHAAVKQSGNTGEMILEVLTLSCAHPSEPRVGIMVGYSHRHYPRNSDSTLIEKGTNVLNSVELFEPSEPYLSEEQKSNIALTEKFTALCSGIIGQSLPTLEINGNDPTPLEKLAAMDLSIERSANVNQIGSYALFEKDEEDKYSLISIQPFFIEPRNIEQQEELFISTTLNKIAPAFETQHFNENTQAFVCETGTKYVTGIDSSYRSAYNPCDSAITTASNIGSAVVANTLLTVLSLGTNVVTGSTVTYVNTDKEKVAKLIVESNLYQCLKEAKRTQPN